MGMASELFKSILHPGEIKAMLQLKYGGMVRKTHKAPLEELAKSLGDIDFCYAVLNKVSRSFAVVIQQLPEVLKDPVCVFYLVLRGLDSVEDDMTFSNHEKIPLLRVFHEKLLVDDWHINGVGDSDDYRVLLAHFGKVVRVFKALDKKYQDVIKDITDKMGNGMADFAEKKVSTVQGYNLYCHYVAGLVGHGLSGLFSASGLEDANLKNELRVANSMGLFLQKTNIIRDYLEDLVEGRTWWPDEIWKKYADRLSYFRDHPYDTQKSLACLNHMVTDALQHVPDCLEYMRRLRDPQVFRFCAIPQVMAIATLSKVYNNSNVFTGVVKIRKGLSCQLMVNTNDMRAVKDAFRSFALSMEQRVPPNDPNASKTMELLQDVKRRTRVELPKNLLRVSSFVAWIVLIVAGIFLFGRFRDRRNAMQQTGNTTAIGSAIKLQDFGAVVALFLSVAYLFGFFGMNLL
eukprot:TRINITY_DN114395_c0_g1_i1.p1 TRINITY_DN114395_c0_g1~~TRINITY_DN114395_c0_g1_i1.p1  ORF type:complete len:459 (-),score=270.46 TRINITY_DN114395_c0_g1_i1:163-1539(-)